MVGEMNRDIPQTTPKVWGPVALAMTGAIQFTYKNWRGKVSERTAERLSIWFGATEWHPEPQWLMSAVDVDKGERRDFAMRDMSNVRNERYG